MDFQNRNNAGNKFVCPSDRQLALRAKLKSGWSSSTSKSTEPLRPDEQAAIISVIRRNEEIEVAERQRVGRLVERVEKIKQRVGLNERGPNSCRLCGEAFGLLRPTRVICEDCRKAVCAKCSVDINIRYYTRERTREVWLCRICSETREMWKKSGAWFFKGIPSYEMPSSTSSTPTRQLQSSNGLGATSCSLTDGAVSELLAQRVTQSCTTTPTRGVRVKKLTIRVNDSSSSSDEENERVAALAPPSSSDAPNRRMEREDSLRMRTYGSIRSFIDGGERKLSNAFFFARQSASQPDFDTISTTSTVGTSYSATPSASAAAAAAAAAAAGRRESRRGSVSSSWSVSDSSSGNSAATGATHITHVTCNSLPAAATHCRDPLLGWLEVAITYRDYHTLDCTLVRARDLPAMDAAGLTDPYCKLNVITPEGHTKYTRWQRTKTVHKTRNPEFNETLSFVGIEPEELGNALLYVAIFDDDKYGHDFLGAAKLCLSTLHSTPQYRISVPLSGEDQYSTEAENSIEWPHGKMLLSLCYNTKRRTLAVKVKQCINLIPMDNNGSSDPFVKLQLKPDAHKNKKYKTGIKWRTLNPIYNEEFNFEASPTDLNKQTLILTVWDKDLGKSNDFLGSLIIGHQSKGERLQQWLDCIRMPDHFHEKWHCLSGEHPHVH